MGTLLEHQSGWHYWCIGLSDEILVLFLLLLFLIFNLFTNATLYFFYFNFCHRLNGIKTLSVVTGYLIITNISSLVNHTSLEANAVSNSIEFDTESC